MFDFSIYIIVSSVAVFNMLTILEKSYSRDRYLFNTDLYFALLNYNRIRNIPHRFCFRSGSISRVAKNVEGWLDRIEKDGKC